MTDKTNATTGCEYCDAGHRAVKLKRQWVHYLRRLGRTVVCEAKTLKRAAA